MKTQIIKKSAYLLLTLVLVIVINTSFSNERDANNINFDIETESPLELEDWMINDNHFKIYSSEVDQPLELEDWMINDNYFKIYFSEVEQHLEEIRIFNPYYKFENNILQVSYLNNSQKNVFLNIYSEGEYVTGQKMGKELCIQKAFDFSKLEKGTYDIVLTNNNNYFSFTVQK